ncbi:MAG TPA: LytTR family DNA-binding domain-containing protein [Opitutaceae bacterium]|jgi:two-component system LytT family response regulator
MRTLKVLIADDEPLARARIRALLSGRPGIQVTSECADGAAALAEMLRNPPDIAILDIRMPGRTGLQIVREMPPGLRPVVIVATAHHEHAVEAFDEEAADYLLKPFDRGRLDLALRRASARVRERDQPAGAPAPAERLAVRVDGRIVFMRPSEIAWVEAASNYCVFHLLGGRRMLARVTMASLEGRLGGSGFVRANRSALVNADEVAELVPERFGDYAVLLRSGGSIPLSRKMRRRIRDIVEARRA